MYNVKRMQTLIITNISVPYAERPSPKEKSLKQFVHGVNSSQNGQQVEFCSVQDLLFVIRDGRPDILWRNRSLRTIADIVYLRNAGKFTDYANALRLYCDAHGISMINYEDAKFPYYGKVSQGFLYALHGIPTPDLVSSPEGNTLLDYLKNDRPNGSLIIKDCYGIKGLRNYLVKNIDEAEQILLASGHHYVVQPYIENSGELRILTFGLVGEKVIFKKNRVDGSHLNNTSQGGKAIALEEKDVPSGVLDTVENILQLTGRELIGVDFLLAEDGKWYVLEANTTPALDDGAFPELKVEMFGRMVQALALGRRSK